MPYLDSGTFSYYKPWRTVSATGDVDASTFNMMVEEFSSEINRFHDSTTDICSVSDSTMESYLHAKYLADLIEENLVYQEMAANIAPQNRVDMKAPSLFDANHLHMKEALIREKREEKPRAYNYNMRTGRIKKWY